LELRAAWARDDAGRGQRVRLELLLLRLLLLLLLLLLLVLLLVLLLTLRGARAIKTVNEYIPNAPLISSAIRRHLGQQLQLAAAAPPHHPPSRLHHQEREFARRGGGDLKHHSQISVLLFHAAIRCTTVQYKT